MQIFHNVTVEFEAFFETEMIFCGCSLEIDKHDEVCPNYGKKAPDDSPIAYLTLRLADGRMQRMRLDKYTWLEDTEGETLDH